MKTANDVACSHGKSAVMDTFPSLNVLYTLLVLRGPDVTASFGRFQIPGRHDREQEARK
jgi:hypothetical protein